MQKKNNITSKNNIYIKNAKHKKLFSWYAYCLHSLFMLMKLKILLPPKIVTFQDERIDFDLLFKDTNKLKCSLTKEKRDKMYGKNWKNTIGKFKANNAIIVEEIFWIKNEKKKFRNVKFRMFYYFIYLVIFLI